MIEVIGPAEVWAPLLDTARCPAIWESVVLRHKIGRDARDVARSSKALLVLCGLVLIGRAIELGLGWAFVIFFAIGLVGHEAFQTLDVVVTRSRSQVPRGRRSLRLHEYDRVCVFGSVDLWLVFLRLSSTWTALTWRRRGVDGG